MGPSLGVHFTIPSLPGRGNRVEPEPTAMEIQLTACCVAWGESLPALGLPPLTRTWGHNALRLEAWETLTGTL